MRYFALKLLHKNQSFSLFKHVPHADTLHVLRSAGVDEAVDLVGSKGILGPLILKDWHHVRVTVEKERRQTGILTLKGHEHRGLALDALFEDNGKEAEKSEDEQIGVNAEQPDNGMEIGTSTVL